MQGKPQQNYQFPPQRRPGKGLLIRLLPWALILVAILTITLFAARAMNDRRVQEQVAPYESVFAPNVSIDGIGIGGMTPQEAHEAVTRHHQTRVNGWQLALTYQGFTFTTINYQTLGLTVMTDQINSALKEAWDLTHTGDARSKLESIEALQAAPYVRTTMQNEINDSALDSMLAQIAPSINRNPVDGAFVQFLPDREDPFLFQPEISGLRLDVQKAKADIMEMAARGASGTFEFEPEMIEAAVKVADLRNQYTLRAVAQTAISRSSPENRNMNIRVSLGRINGLIMNPGDIFSFNKVAGPRTYKNGYYEAEELVYGDLVTGIGGGVCQSSTTLYQAALMAGLSITSRRAHSDPVNYADPGTDATVYYFGGREIDFKFRNSTSSPLFLAARVKGSGRNLVSEIRIFGESLGNGVSYQLATNVLEVLAPPAVPVYKLDKLAQHVVYEDEVLQYSKPKDGYVVQTYLKKTVNGVDTGEVREVGRDTYRAKAEVLWKGVTPRM